MRCVSHRAATSIIFSFFSSLYGFFLSYIPHEYFKDRVSYLDNIKSAEDRLDILSGLKGLFLEPGFTYLNYSLSLIFTDTFILRIYVFFIAFTCSYLVFRYSANVLMAVLGMALIIFVPNLWSLQLGALRQGLAASLIFWAFHFFKHDNFKLLFAVFLSGFVHLAGFLIFLVLLADKTLKQLFPRIGPLGRNLFLSLGLIVGWLGVGFIVPFLASKHSAYTEQSTAVGGGLFFFYFVFMFLVYVGNRYVRQWHGFELMAFTGVSTYLALYFLSPISGRWLDFFVLPLVLLLVSNCSFRSLILTSIFFLVNVSLFFGGTAENIMNKPLW